MTIFSNDCFAEVIRHIHFIYILICISFYINCILHYKNITLISSHYEYIYPVSELKSRQITDAHLFNSKLMSSSDQERHSFFFVAKKVRNK